MLANYPIAVETVRSDRFCRTVYAIILYLQSFFLIRPFVSPRIKFVELSKMNNGENIRLRMNSMLSHLHSSKNTLIRSLMISNTYVKSLVLARKKGVII